MVPDRVESLYGVGLLNEQMMANKRLAGFEAVELNAPGLTLNLPDAKFDAVLCNVLPYIAQPAQLLREARRCIKDDGIIVVSWSSISQHMMAKHWRDRTGLVPNTWRLLRYFYFRKEFVRVSRAQTVASSLTTGFRINAGDSESFLQKRKFKNLYLGKLSPRGLSCLDALTRIEYAYLAGGLPARISSDQPSTTCCAPTSLT